jgi:hypothetical protein
MENRYAGVSVLSWAQLQGESVEATAKVNGTFTLSDGSKVQLVQGAKLSLPRWAVKELGSKLEIGATGLKTKDVALSAWMEENDPKTLKDLDPLFYARACYQLSGGEEKELRAALSELLSLRKRKIMEAAMSGRDDPRFYSAMTAEEKRFYDDLKGCVEEWQDFLVRVLSGLPPIEGKG